MKKINTCLFFLLCFVLGTMAQTVAKRIHKTPISNKNALIAHYNTSNNSVSLNYQRKILGTNRSYFSGGLGLASSGAVSQNIEFLSKNTPISFDLPHNILYNYGNTNGHFAEIGVGADYLNIFSAFKNINYNVYPLLGYRYQPTNSKLFVHLYLAPVLSQQREVKGNQCLACPIEERSAVLPSGGIGAGWRF